MSAETSTPTVDTDEPRSHWTGTAPTTELDRWDAVARHVADQLAPDALSRDRANEQPVAETALLRDSGLLSLLYPAEFGGGGAHWESALRAIRTIARVDGSIAQLLGYHYINSANITLVAPGSERERWFRASIDGGWLWGDAVNPVDPSLTLTPDQDRFILRGKKRFSTGSGVRSALVATAAIDGGEHAGKHAFVAFAPGREGIEVVDDWDHLGQRLSASNSVIFHDVTVERGDLLGFISDEPFESLITPGIQLVFGNLYLGLAEGAIERGLALTRARKNAWFLSGAEQYRHDPFVQRLYGELGSRTAAVAALADRANVRFDEVLSLGHAVNADDRGRIEIEIAQLKVVSSDLATDVTTRVFEATGSSSTASHIGLDLFWRNARTHSLHDPIDYKKLEVGAWLLNHELQPISLYT